MFRSFFFNRKWMHWSIFGSLLILVAIWCNVQLSVQINDWYRVFYDLIQKAVAKSGSVSMSDYTSQTMVFGKVAALSMLLSVLLDFFTKHFVFRWRTAMNDFYVENWHKVRHIEGASQRVQEDTKRFASIMEDLGVSFIQSVMTLIAFLPILWELSKNVTTLPLIGSVEHSLVYVAILFALAGTVALALIGVKLPGLEFNNQRVEAAYRKELVCGEDDETRATLPVLKDFFAQVRKNNFRLYFHYMYFNVAKYSYLQFGQIVPYIALGPTIVAGGLLTFGLIRQIAGTFSQVESSFQYLVNSWGDIVVLMSVYKRLRVFEEQILNAKGATIQ
jgi:peptide/bleomycin uptake transporter